jgi:hypothetical protein
VYSYVQSTKGNQSINEGQKGTKLVTSEVSIEIGSSGNQLISILLLLFFF